MRGLTFAILIPLLSFAEATLASVMPVSPFSGQYSETWESFPAFAGEGDYLASPAGIMGGTAQISDPFMVVYQYPAPVTFSLGTSGSARTSDGTKGMGADRFDQTVTISFSNPVYSFGAYWGAFTDNQVGGNPAFIAVHFFDQSNAPIADATFSYVRPGDGVLEWHGWSSDIPIKRITYTEDFVVIDGLQANPVPEPTAAALAALGGALILMRRRCRFRPLHLFRT